MKAVIVNCFDTYQHRADMVANVLRGAGFSVVQYRADFSHRDKAPCRADDPAVRWIHVSPYRRNLSLRRLLSHLGFARRSVRALRQEQDVTLVWALVPPNTLVRSLARQKAAGDAWKLVFDVMDLWPESFPLQRWKKTPPMRLWRGLRDRWLGQADLIATECDLFRKALADAAPSVPMHRLYEARPALPQLPAPALSEAEFSFCYLGSMNHILDLDAMETVLCQAGTVRPVILHLIGGGERKQELLSRAQAAGARIIDHGLVYDPAEKAKIFSQCHAGLNLMKPGVCVGLTMKSADYLAAGLPLINNIPGDTWDAVEREKIGLNCSGHLAQEIAAADWVACRRNAKHYFDAFLSEERFITDLREILRRLALIP